MVAGAERYRLDGGSFLSPMDLLLTWGELPEEPYKSVVDYDQSARFYFWRVPSRDFDLRYIQEHSSNMHMIPGSANVRRALLSVDPGDEVRVSGLLVDASIAGGYNWRSSLSRTDSGPGACELVWVEELQIGAKVYR